MNSNKKVGCVLLADRHPSMLEGVRSLLEKVFEVVVMVSDERSLIDSLEKIKPDLAIVDLSLPMTGGLSVTHRVKEIRPEVKVIILSVHDESTVIDDCISSGASAFVLKRTTANDLIPAIWEVLKGRTYISPSIEAEE